MIYSLKDIHQPIIKLTFKIKSIETAFIGTSTLIGYLWKGQEGAAAGFVLASNICHIVRTFLPEKPNYTSNIKINAKSNDLKAIYESDYIIAVPQSYRPPSINFRTRLHALLSSPTLPTNDQLNTLVDSVVDEPQSVKQALEIMASQLNRNEMVVRTLALRISDSLFEKTQDLKVLEILGNFAKENDLLDPNIKPLDKMYHTTQQLQLFYQTPQERSSKYFSKRDALKLQFHRS